MESVSNQSDPTEKIALFRSRFRGRSEVYARRFESARDRRAGYSPACGNEWVRGVCQKPKIKCSACPHQAWLPVSDDVITSHLRGCDAAGQPFVMGVYPMLADETCFFLAVDFDGAHWVEDATEFVEVCREHKIPIALERSRSGNGGHGWIFFDDAVPAALARRLGTFLLSETLERRPGVGLKSYDRLFPNQDTLPRGGFGNLIALPLQKASRNRGNSVFIDHAFRPWPDQWKFLSALEILGKVQLEAIVQAAEMANRILPIRMVIPDEFALEPWKSTPSRKSEVPTINGLASDRIEIILADQIYVLKDNLPAKFRSRVIALAAFQNPEFFRAQAMRLPTFGKPRIIACAEEHEAHIGLPRGCLDDLISLFKSARVKVRVRDQRYQGQRINVSFKGQLRPDQAEAAKAMAKTDIGVLAAGTAFGKTVLAAWLIAQRNVNTLILVHRRQLMDQWADRLAEFLDIHGKQIGRLGGGRRKLTGQLDIALIQSLVRNGTVDDRVAGYGHLVVDECHHLPARSFELVAHRSSARFVTGLSATVARKDGHHPIIFMQCGPIRYRVDAGKQARDRPFDHRVVVRPTSFQTDSEAPDDPRAAFGALSEALFRDVARNDLIARDISAALAEGRNPIVLTERTEHLEILANLLSGLDVQIIVLRGGLGGKMLRDAFAKLGSVDHSQPRVILATGRFVGEGFDDARLDTLFLVMPISWRGTVTQYVGRLHRLHEGKNEVRVYDYADLEVPMLERMFNRRCAAYEEAGYSISVPASAMSGWPQAVPLPSDPTWKRDYAASVRRMIVDGVDANLADLFVHAARRFDANAVGIARARSASEAFLFRRLETLPSTKGKFRLNHHLPIPFELTGTMEVDFFCTEANLVIELDGPQHLASESAWRTDRRKDALLQQHGCMVLRFLDTDIGTRLGETLDAISAALSSRLR